jgi:outer membrane protein
MTTIRGFSSACALLLALAAAPVAAQTAPRNLSLSDAISLARRNNPAWLSVRNDEEASAWAVRESYASLLPSASANGSVTWQEAGVQRIGTVDLGAGSDLLSSRYGLGVSWSLDGGSLFQVASARANHRATEAAVTAGELDLDYRVTLQYMTALRARDGIDVARRQRDLARQNHDLVRVRAEAGAVPMVDAKQAEVERGRAEVELIKAERAYRAELLRLSEQMGVVLEGEVELATAAEPFAPTWTLDDLLERALASHPSLLAARAREAAGRAQVRQARSGYLPSFSVATGWSGSTIENTNKDFLVTQTERSLASQRDRCQLENALVGGLATSYPGFPRNCAQYVLTDAARTDLIQGSEVFPFDFTKNPLQVQFAVSVPLFNGFSIQRQVEQAVAVSKDVTEGRRSEELRLRTAVTQAYDAVVTQVQVIEIETTNRAIAEERITMARQRYALGATSIIELLDAQTSLQTAERDYLNARYQFQIDLTNLEAASGVRLRPEAE